MTILLDRPGLLAAQRPVMRVMKYMGVLIISCPHVSEHDAQWVLPAGVRRGCPAGVCRLPEDLDRAAALQALVDASEDAGLYEAVDGPTRPYVVQDHPGRGWDANGSPA